MNIFKEVDKEVEFLRIILLLFGGVGQIITGCLEYIKGRTFSTTLYLTYGIYFLSYFYAKKSDHLIIENSGSNLVFNDDVRKIYFGSWACLSFPLVIGSIRINILYILQTLAICAFFVIKCIGECRGIDVLKSKVSGILELV